MEEQTTWKGHTFTLLVFTGIVVLCSISWNARRQGPGAEDRIHCRRLGAFKNGCETRVE
jgi:hypothetical protein